MAAYLANQIILGKLEYGAVTAKKPNLKAYIDTYLSEQDRGDLIEG